MRKARSVRPSESRSEKEWPASAIIAAERPYTPANSLKKARATLTRAPIHVMREALSVNSCFRSAERATAWRRSAE